jgi:hypothetical protein
MTIFFGLSLHTTTLLDKTSGVMDADHLHRTAFPSTREQSATCTKATVDGDMHLSTEVSVFWRPTRTSTGGARKP